MSRDSRDAIRRSSPSALNNPSSMATKTSRLLNADTGSIVIVAFIELLRSSVPAFLVRVRFRSILLLAGPLRCRDAGRLGKGAKPLSEFPWSVSEKDVQPSQTTVLTFRVRAPALPALPVWGEVRKGGEAPLRAYS